MLQVIVQTTLHSAPILLAATIDVRTPRGAPHGLHLCHPLKHSTDDFDGCYLWRIWCAYGVYDILKRRLDSIFHICLNEIFAGGGSPDAIMID